jgi:hypothetical protein
VPTVTLVFKASCVLFGGAGTIQSNSLCKISRSQGVPDPLEQFVSLGERNSLAVLVLCLNLFFGVGRSESRRDFRQLTATETLDEFRYPKTKLTWNTSALFTADFRVGRNGRFFLL